MKKLFVLIPLLAALVLPVAGQTLTTWSATVDPGTNNITTNGGWLTSFSFYGTNEAPSTMRLFDCSARSNYVWTAVFTNSARINVTVTELVTNVHGGSWYTNTYTASSNALTSAKWTNIYPLLASATVGSNVVYSVTYPGEGIPFTRGLFLTNTGGGTFTFTYRTR